MLFSAAMVRAILDGRKTQTRRVMRTQPSWDPDRACWRYESSKCTASWSGPRPLACASLIANDDCPYGVPGDRLWVRETFMPWSQSSYECDEWESWRDAQNRPTDMRAGRTPDVIEYRATSESEGPWWPAIHMPREASRILLEVTSVRVERLQDITPADILAEGVVLRAHHDALLGKCPISAFDERLYVDLMSLWRSGWDGINGARPGCSWAANPWVWVVGFRRVEP